MKFSARWQVPLAAAGVALVVAGCAGMGMGGGGGMSFFVTSNGKGNGADYGGLAGADAHCQSLAATAGAGGKTWRAYLSTQAKDGAQLVNARDRIGSGPWRNAKGDLIASNVDELHGAKNNITKATAAERKG